MFLCEVGMNNTLVGLLHPQADEKMFNFSKCSAPSLFLSVSFPSLWLFVSAGLCLWVFTCWRPEECCWFASSVFTVGFKRMLSITNKRQHLHLQTRMNKLVVWAQHCSINWYNFKSCVTFTGLLALREKSSPSDFFLMCVCVHIASKCAGKTICYQLAITKGMEMCRKPTWWGTSSPLRNLEKCEELDICQLPRLAQPGSTQAHLVNSANYANQKPNDDDDEGV